MQRELDKNGRDAANTVSLIGKAARPLCGAVQGQEANYDGGYCTGEYTMKEITKQFSAQYFNVSRVIKRSEEGGA